MSKLNLCRAVMLVLLAVLLIGCLTGGVVYGDGGGGQIPDPPPLHAPGSGTGGIDGCSVLDAIVTAILLVI